MRKRVTLVIVAVGAVLALTTTAVAAFNFGLFRDQQLSDALEHAIRSGQAAR